MVYGKCPYEANVLGGLIMLIEKEGDHELRLPRRKGVDEVLEELIKRMLSKDSSKRIDWK